MGVAFSPDGRLVAATDLNHTPGALPFLAGSQSGESTPESFCGDR